MHAATEASYAQIPPAPPPRDRNPISNWRLSAYVLPSLSLSFLFLPIANFIPAYYASTLQMDLGTIGFLLLASRSLDVIIDPVLGRWSDSTPQRFGRRTLWMWLSIPIITGGAYALLIPPVEPTGSYFLLASFAIYFGGSCLGLSYAAWGTEIVETYHGRARMAAFQGIAATIGSVMAASIPAFADQHGVDRFTMSVFAWMIIGLTPLTVCFSIRAARDIPIRAQRTDVPWLRSIAELWANRPFRILGGAFVLFSIGGSIVGATLLFFITDYLGNLRTTK